MFLAGAVAKEATYTPWVGRFDPDETDSPQRGINVGFISEDLEAVVLTLNQGMDKHFDNTAMPSRASVDSGC
jgi:hypothetical protein